MAALIFFLLSLGGSIFKSKSRLEAENAALRQQLTVFSILIEMETLVDEIGKKKLKLKPRAFTLGPSTKAVKDKQDIPMTGADQK
jgi:hypothetical protein